MAGQTDEQMLYFSWNNSPENMPSLVSLEPKQQQVNGILSVSGIAPVPK